MTDIRIVTREVISHSKKMRMRIQMPSDNFTAMSVISGFRSCVNEIRALLEFYVASSKFLADWLSRKAGEKLPLYAG
jgi:hypothetical protein